MNSHVRSAGKRGFHRLESRVATAACWHPRRRCAPLATETTASPTTTAPGRQAWAHCRWAVFMGWSLPCRPAPSVTPTSSPSVPVGSRAADTCHARPGNAIFWLRSAARAVAGAVEMPIPYPQLLRMSYLLAIIVPPLAILMQGRPLQAIFNGLLWLGGLLFILLPFVAGQAAWLIAVIWSVAVVYNRRQDARDRRLIDEALRRQRE